jgi:hypothetical protein
MVFSPAAQLATGVEIVPEAPRRMLAAMLAIM